MLQCSVSETQTLKEWVAESIKLKLTPILIARNKKNEMVSLISYPFQYRNLYILQLIDELESLHCNNLAFVIDRAKFSEEFFGVPL